MEWVEYLEEAVGAVRRKALRAEARTAVEAKDVLLVLLRRLVDHARVEELLPQHRLKPARHAARIPHLLQEIRRENRPSPNLSPSPTHYRRDRTHTIMLPRLLFAADDRPSMRIRKSRSGVSVRSSSSNSPHHVRHELQESDTTGEWRGGAESRGWGRRGEEQGKGDVDLRWPPGGALAVLLPKEKQGRMAKPAFNGATKRFIIIIALHYFPSPPLPYHQSHQQ